MKVPLSPVAAAHVPRQPPVEPARSRRVEPPELRPPTSARRCWERSTFDAGAARADAQRAPPAAPPRTPEPRPPEVELTVAADGRLQASETKRPSVLSRLGGALTSGFMKGAQAFLDVSRAVTTPFVSLIRGPQSTGPTPPYEQLSSRQRELLGEGGRGFYDALSPLQRGGFLLLTQRMDGLGIGYSGLHLKGGSGGVEQAKLKLDGPPEALARLRRSFEEGLREGRFLFEAPSSVFHAGENDTGGRENRADYSLQLGIGPEGAFVDIDRYNPLVGKGAEHFFLEVLIGGNTVNPFDAARALGERLCAPSRQNAPSRDAAVR